MMAAQPLLHKDSKVPPSPLRGSPQLPARRAALRPGASAAPGDHPVVPGGPHCLISRTANFPEPPRMASRIPGRWGTAASTSAFPSTPGRVRQWLQRKPKALTKARNISQTLGELPRGGLLAHLEDMGSSMSVSKTAHVRSSSVQCPLHLPLNMPIPRLTPAGSPSPHLRGDSENSV